MRRTTVHICVLLALVLLLPSFAEAKKRSRGGSGGGGGFAPPGTMTREQAMNHENDEYISQPPAVGGAVTFLGKTSPETKHWQDEMEKQRKALQEVVNEKYADFSQTSEFKAQAEAITKAQEELTIAQAEAIEPLRSNSAYTEALAIRTARDKEIERMKAEGATAEEKTALLQKTAQAATLVTRMEGEAVKGNAKVQECKNKLEQARTAMLSLRSQFMQSLEGDSRFSSINQKLQTARDKFADATARVNRGMPAEQ